MIKLALLKSGEEVISEMKEMYASEQVVGYILHNPCRAILTSPEIRVDDDQEHEKQPVSIKLLPWMPLSKDEDIPVVALSLIHI